MAAPTGAANGYLTLVPAYSGGPAAVSCLVNKDSNGALTVPSEIWQQNSSGDYVPVGGGSTGTSLPVALTGSSVIAPGGSTAPSVALAITKAQPTVVLQTLANAVAITDTSAHTFTSTGSLVGYRLAVLCLNTLNQSLSASALGRIPGGASYGAYGLANATLSGNGAVAGFTSDGTVTGTASLTLAPFWLGIADAARIVVTASVAPTSGAFSAWLVGVPL